MVIYCLINTSRPFKGMQLQDHLMLVKIIMFVHAEHFRYTCINNILNVNNGRARVLHSTLTLFMNGANLPHDTYSAGYGKMDCG